MLAAPIRRRIGATSRLAKLSPSSTADSSMVSAITVYISAKATWMPSRRDFDLGIFGDAGLGLLQLADHARIEQARDVKEGVVEGAQVDDGGDVIGLREHRDLRLVLVDIAEEFLRRRGEFLLDAGLRALQDVAILVDQHRAGSPRGGLRGQEFAKRPRSWSNSGLARAMSMAMPRMSPRISWACS